MIISRDSKTFFTTFFVVKIALQIRITRVKNEQCLKYAVVVDTPRQNNANR